MLISSTRPPVLGLTSSSSPPPNHHHIHVAADLSSRSSNSSIVSSSESLLNTSLSIPSPEARENVSSPGTGQGSVSPLQCLQNAFDARSPFRLFHETDHLEQHKFGMFPITGGDIKSEGEKTDDEEMQRNAQSPPSNLGASTIFQCPLCTMICNSRHDFNEHLVTHSQQHACPKCSFITNSEEELRDHVQVTHGVDDLNEILSDEEMKTPKTNAQGKLKTFKCKHCEHRAVTKKEFWDHAKTHIREDKMLHCPKCPFITEYKHHLEYHLRNHMDSKPYQCTKCNYSCVNKSMLNSHLKSHSNIYQYRCSDCSYATKYCHSLKLHLRKYNHNPAMVLNPDGTPNPLPIIDVYGTRRGPKIKRPDPILEGLATTTPALPCSPNTTFITKPAKTPKKATPAKKIKAERNVKAIVHSPLAMSTPPLKNRHDSSGDSDTDLRLQQHPLHLQNNLLRLPQAPISPSSIALILQQDMNAFGADRKDFQSSQPNALQQIYNAAVNQYLMNSVLGGGGTAHIQEIIAKQLLGDKGQSRAPYPPQHMANDLRVNANQESVTPFPLDLRNPRNDEGNGEESKRRKRKGKALKYERRFSSDLEEDTALDFSNNNNYDYKKQPKVTTIPTDLSPSANLLCKYCDISFPDRELYSIHMSFHSGDIDPFLCRSCGKKTKDKVDFFRHLTTDPH